MDDEGLDIVAKLVLCIVNWTLKALALLFFFGIVGGTIIYIFKADAYWSCFIFFVIAIVLLYGWADQRINPWKY
jgi:hypothetical protein